MKVIKSLENRGILLKGTTRKITSQERVFKFSYAINDCRFTIDEKCTKSRISTETSEADSAIQKKIYRSGTTALIISNEEMVNIMKIVKSREQLRLLIKGISETNKNEMKKQKFVFLLMLLGTLAASVLANAFTGREVIRAGFHKQFAGF